ncbi:sugar kinase [Bacillus sp. JJ1521]|uniref:sugar kinase n=1 Tax=Bacillus sp. JJ1521 TaxID=3122957 RepID=UPI002FFFE731
MDVVTIGETMALFTPETTGMMRYAKNFTMKFGGAESNVAIGLSRLGHQVGWISRVGNDEFGKGILSYLRGEGIDTSRVKIDSESSTGIYFKEPRRQDDFRIYYYRKNSAASKLNKYDLDEHYISQAKYLHLTGITPALSEGCYEMIMEAINIAKRHHVKIVFDPNLRTKLWNGETARKALLFIASKADIILPGIDEAHFIFGEDNYKELGKKFLELGASIVVLKLGAKGAYYFTQHDSAIVPGYHVDHVVDPVGAGDGFAAGFLSGMLNGLPIKCSVERANAVGSLVTRVEGDVEGLPEMEEINAFINNGFIDVVR